MLTRLEVRPAPVCVHHQLQSYLMDIPGYHLPNDDEELSRLDLQHRVWQHTIDGLYRVPIDRNSIHNAMDIGTGSGIWAIDFAVEHPSCNIIGTDLSPFQPAAIPPNCQFIVDDADTEVGEWSYPRMDYIHSRLLVPGLKNWKQYIKRCFKHLKPGGWIELQEVECPLKCPDGTASDDEPFMKWSRLFAEAGEKAGCDFQVQNKLKDYLEEAGFTNITREDYKWAIGPWTEDQHLNEVGAYMLINGMEMLNSCRLFLPQTTRMVPGEA